MYDDLTLPTFDTMEATLLVKLLNGQVVDNQTAKDILGSANPATIMSHLRAKGWDEVIERETFRGKSSNGYDVNYKKYWIERNTILNLMKNERIKKFVQYVNKLRNL